jgi:hypothetical protein
MEFYCFGINWSSIKIPSEMKVFFNISYTFGFFSARWGTNFLLMLTNFLLNSINFVMTVFGLFLVYAYKVSSGDGDDDEDFSETAGANL